jgi:ribosome-associated toxin RatA of RatAB toxin-antitoxin module
MRDVAMAVSVPGLQPDDVFRTVADYARYPELTDAVISVQTAETAPGRHRCTWEVRFRRGILVWTEEGIVDAERRRLDFTLVEGDLDHLAGHWQVDPATGGSLVRFCCEFDIGIPSLAALIEPVAAGALQDNVVTICRGLFGQVEPLEPTAPAGP